MTGNLPAANDQPSTVAFVFEGHDIRSISTNGKAEFAAKDVLAALDIKGDVSAQLAKLPAGMKRVLRRREVSPSDSETFAHLFAGSAPSATLITREGAKMLAMRSDKPSALEFQRQLVVMSESVDDHGGYIRSQENASPELQAKAQEFTRRVAGLIAAEERDARSDAFALLKGRR